MRIGLRLSVALDICLMRSLYWKIFFSFWVASILILITTAVFTSRIAQESSIPAREKVFMDSYANAAVAIYEASEHKALIAWMNKTSLDKKMSLFLLTSNGDIIGTKEPPDLVKKISHIFVQHQLQEGIQKSGDISISHEIKGDSGTFYRLAAISETPLAQFVKIHWENIALLLFAAIITSGLICYLLSVYLTKPIRSLQMAARSIAKGHLSTRVGKIKGHSKDEIAELRDEFDHMAEEIEELMNSKKRLLQDISHEFRSPLARIQVAIELSRKKSDHLAEAELQRMELECQRMNQLISEILHFARLNQSTHRRVKKEINLTDLLKQIIHDAQYEFKNKLPQITLTCPTNNILIKADERLLQRALENILRNALKYSTPPQKIEVIVKLIDEHWIEIIIEDNGPGIPKEQLNKIFSPFFRVDPAREKKTGGYGLGLAIAEQAIHIHDGTIEAINRLKGGLKVKINLPI